VAVLNKKGNFVKRLLVFELLLFELATFAVMELYKYYYNLSPGSFFSRTFFSQFLKSFNIFYTGNLLWLFIFILALVSLINILRNLDKVREEALTVLAVFTVLLTVLFIISVFLPGSDAVDRFTGNFVQLGTKSTKTIALSLFAVLKIFLAISYSVIAFSALKKYYIFRSIWITIFIMLIGVLIVFLSIYYYKDDYNALSKENKKLDAGVILGAAVWGGNRPSPVLRERINKGYELYKNGIIGYLVLTGGGSPGEMTEADVAKNELLKKGINEKNIIVENRSNSTLEQIGFVNKNLYQKNNWKEIVLITDNFHLLRSSQMCSFFNIKARTVASDTPLSAESTFSFSMKESFALILFWLFGIG
jgi:vancomycin permeability regulator SanA